MSLGLQKLNYFKEVLAIELKNCDFTVKDITVKKIQKSYVVFILCNEDQTAVIELNKAMIKQIIKNTEENLSLKYLVLNIQWRF